LNFGWSFSYAYWAGYGRSEYRNLPHYANLISHNTADKVNNLMRTVAERATSRSDTVILSDLTCTPDDGGGFDGEISRPWVSSGTLQICANHISGDEVMGGSTLYNDGSVEWQKLSSMQNSIDEISMFSSAIPGPIRVTKVRCKIQ